MAQNSPCAACKFLRRKCTQGCVFAPYFPPENPAKFANVHRVFGASNVAKLLNDLSPGQREEAVNSLAYEAEARLRDPVYGCVGYISILQHKLKQVQTDLYSAKLELSNYIGPAAHGPFFPHAAMVSPHQLHFQAGGASGSAMPPFGVPGMMPLHPQILQQQQQQQMVEAQQMAAVAREQELLRSYEQQQQQQIQIQQQDFMRINSGFNQMVGGGASVAVAARPLSSGLGLIAGQGFDNMLQVQQLYPEQHQQQHQRDRSDDGRNGVGPSS